MREIKFRGKNIHGWHYGLLTFMFGQYAMSHKEDENKVDLIDEETIGQYTGLKDKNGIEIYEGDVCRDQYDEVGQIKFDEGRFSFEWGSISEDLFEVCGDIEFIGNIYEHSYLLE